MGTRTYIQYSVIACFFFIFSYSGVLPATALECIDTRFLFDIKPNADQPSDIAVGPDGDIYLVDGVNNRVIVVDKNGRWKFAFGRRGSGQGQFLLPLGIDVSGSGRVFVADTGNHRIQEFDRKGNFISLFNISTARGDKPADPVDVAHSPLNGTIYVSDNENHRIQVYSPEGMLEFQWGSFGEANGEFRYPAIMALNEFNEIFIVDVLNTRAQKFDPYGKFISSTSSWGVLPGRLFRPKGIAIDRLNRVYISDSYMGVIQVFTDAGRFLGVICEKTRPKRFITPVGIAIDRTNRLLVVEMRADKVSVLQVMEN